MTTTTGFAFTWTDPDGTPRASAVSYDEKSADRRQTELEDAGARDIEMVPVGYGELPQPKA
ncbi:hypothetical protein [Streptomyces sp. NPDC059786]|uniref:hypothetical protein n=1 Tax=Streptomyces sp. NPDC059786 TaxID=3346946 RepID=UPI0036508644